MGGVPAVLGRVPADRPVQESRRQDDSEERREDLTHTEGIAVLILTRSVREEVILTVPPSAEPTTITVTVVKIDRAKARLGFTAPRTVVIDRAEVDAAKRASPTAARP